MAQLKSWDLLGFFGIFRYRGIMPQLKCWDLLGFLGIFRDILVFLVAIDEATIEMLGSFGIFRDILGYFGIIFK